MRKYFKLRTMLAGLGALIIGAMGSGAWDIIFKPLMIWIGSLILDVTTLGIQSIQDDLYAQMSKGVLGRPGQIGAEMAFSIIVAGIALVSVAIAMGALSFARSQVSRVNLVGASLKVAAAKKEKGWLHSPRLIRYLRAYAVFYVVLSCLLAGWGVVVMVRATFIEGGAIYLEQAQRVIAPFIPADQRVLLSSRVARMSSKQDFISIRTDLEKIASTNKVKLPELSMDL